MLFEANDTELVHMSSILLILNLKCYCSFVGKKKPRSRIN